MNYDAPDLLLILNQMEAAALDDLPFGVLHFDDAFNVARYNGYEQLAAALQHENAMGQQTFTQIAKRFQQAMATGTPLDESWASQLTWIGQPTAISLRLLWCAASYGCYVIIQRVTHSDG